MRTWFVQSLRCAHEAPDCILAGSSQVELEAGGNGIGEAFLGVDAPVATVEVGLIRGLVPDLDTVGEAGQERARGWEPFGGLRRNDRIAGVHVARRHSEVTVVDAFVARPNQQL